MDWGNAVDDLGRVLLSGRFTPQMPIPPPLPPRRGIVGTSTGKVRVSPLEVSGAMTAISLTFTGHPGERVQICPIIAQVIVVVQLRRKGARGVGRDNAPFHSFLCFNNPIMFLHRSGISPPGRAFRLARLFVCTSRGRFPSFALIIAVSFEIECLNLFIPSGTPRVVASFS